MYDVGTEDAYWTHIANFGGGFGSAYVFIDRRSTPPGIIWFWSG
jgi:hypothetical protein